MPISSVHDLFQYSLFPGCPGIKLNVKIKKNNLRDGIELGISIRLPCHKNPEFTVLTVNAQRYLDAQIQDFEFWSHLRQVEVSAKVTIKGQI